MTGGQITEVRPPRQIPAHHSLYWGLNNHISRQEWNKHS